MGTSGSSARYSTSTSWPPGRRGGVDRRQHLLRMRELVVGIHDERQVYAVRPQARALLRPKHRRHVGHSEFLGPGLEDAEHLRLNVHRQHAALRHARREPEREVARPRADVRHHIGRIQVQRRHEKIRAFLDLAVCPFQPRSAPVAHHPRNLATEVIAPRPIGRARTFFVDHVGLAGTKRQIRPLIRQRGRHHGRIRLRGRNRHRRQGRTASCSAERHHEQDEQDQAGEQYHRGRTTSKPPKRPKESQHRASCAPARQLTESEGASSWRRGLTRWDARRARRG